MEDFLFTYYRLRPAALRRWHPGVGMRLAAAGDTERARWRWYATAPDGSIGVDVDLLLADRGSTVRLVRDILAGTLSRPGVFSCFGLHEWAMVYGVPEGGQRHESWPLRLGAAGTDAVVDSHHLTCTHLDAYRFFTPQALPRNAFRPTRELAPSMEQPGCLHAGMDLYKHAYHLGPLVPGHLLLACFDLARDLRILDMRASPYDLRDLGYEPIPIETPTGKGVYAAKQRQLAARAEPLRRELLGVCERALGASHPK